MTQPADIQPASIEEILEILRSEAQKMPPSPTSVRYLHALDSLTCNHAGTAGELGSHKKEEDSPENKTLATPPPLRAQREMQQLCADWLVAQWLLGVPYTSASLHLDIISALYGSAVKAGRLPKTDLFSQLKAQLKQLGPDGWKGGIDEEIFARALRLTKNAANLIADDAIAADLVILSLLSPGSPILRNPYCEADTAPADTSYSPLLPLESLALLKKEDLDPNVGTHGSCVRVPSSERAAGLSSGDIASSDTNNLLRPSVGSPASSEPHQESSAPDHPQLASPASRRPQREDPVLQQIIARHVTNARRKYLFPLRQSERTEPQLKKHVAKIVNALFRRVRLPQSPDPNRTVEALWAYAALRTGIPASSVVAHLGHAPLGLPILKLCTPNVGTHGSCVRESSMDRAAGLSSGENNTAPADTAPRADTSYFEENFAHNVGKIFLDNPPRWYAMSLRPGVRFTQVCRRIELLISASSAPHAPLRYNTAPRANTPYCEANTPYSSLQLFYPCEEIARAIGKKIVIKQRPFIHSVVFFKAKITDIGPLFARIGDLAWCYRQSATPGAPYAEISESQFRLFQQTIARFTPDYEVAPAGELELQPNDRVEILGGLFAGHEATFDSVAHGSANCVAMERRASGRRVPSKGNSGQSGSEDSRLKAEDSPTVYRLNIIGDNGIEWRIHVDSRLAKQKT